MGETDTGSRAATRIRHTISSMTEVLENANYNNNCNNLIIIAMYGLFGSVYCPNVYYLF